MKVRSGNIRGMMEGGKDKEKHASNVGRIFLVTFHCINALVTNGGKEG